MKRSTTGRLVARASLWGTLAMSDSPSHHRQATGARLDFEAHVFRQLNGYRLWRAASDCYYNRA